MRAVQYAIVIEHAEGNYSAYVPDLPGCITTGATPEETETNMREAIAVHIDALREQGQPVPAPTTRVGYVGTA